MSCLSISLESLFLTTHHPGTEDSSLIEDIHDFLSLHIDMLISHLLNLVNKTAHVLFCSVLRILAQRYIMKDVVCYNCMSCVVLLCCVVLCHNI